MRDSDTQMLMTVFGGKGMLAAALRVENYSDEAQDAVLGKFCECIFKRVLLRVTPEHIGGVIDAFESHRAMGRSFDFLIDALKSYIPDMSTCIEEELAKATQEFCVQ